MRKAYVYMLRCTDGSLYCGITTDIDRRIREHVLKSSKAAKYTRSHDVCEVSAVFQTESYSCAAGIENKFKRLKKSEKEEIISGASLPEFMAEAKRIENYNFELSSFENKR